MATKNAVLNWARGQIGYVEGRNNSTKYAAAAGHANNQPWCATFLVACFRANKMKLGNESAYTPSLWNSLKGSRIRGPQPGAIVFFYFPLMRRIAHVGIVESVRPDGRFVSIEGNTDSAGGRTGGRVMRKVRSPRNCYFAMPKYTADKAAAKPTAGKGPIPKPFLKYDGDFGPATIKALQARLMKLGYGNVRVTGKFDTATKRALQKHVNVKVDGDFGRNSIAGLQKHMKVGVDGKWGPGTTKAMQKRLNDGVF